MGIKGLSKFLKSYIPQTILERKLSELENKVIAIDANYFMYKYTISSDDYVYKFRRQYEHLVGNNIKALYVFDGKPPKEKKRVIEKRREVNKKKNIDVSVDKIKELKHFFDEKGIPYIECESEADFICCKLCEQNRIHGCISDDMDFLTLGCTHLYRDYYQHSDSVAEYNRETIMKEFTSDEFIDVCIFLGCDYCERVQDFVNRSIDVNVFELFKTHKTLENVWSHLRQTNSFVMVDDEKERDVQSKWQKARHILKNDIMIDAGIVDKIVNLENNRVLLEKKQKDKKPPRPSMQSIQSMQSMHTNKQTRKCFETVNKFDLLVA
jgi:flap endonuclease-1